MQRGGFDVVLGNPPWERVKLEEKEFFATSAPQIASAKGKSNRLKLIEALGTAPKGSAQHNLYSNFMDAKREAEAISEFVRVSDDAGGRFVFTGTGDVNTYALFAELFSALYNKRGQAGVMVPTGIATNDTTAPFFDHLVTQKKLTSLFSYSEIKAWFSGTKDNQSFSLVTLGKSEKAEFCFRIDTASDVEDPRRRFEFTPDEIVRINPNTKTAPVFRSRADAEVTAKIYRNSSVLIEESKASAGNPWRVSFLRLFDMSNDSSLFRTAAQLEHEGLGRDGVDWTAASALSSKATLALERGQQRYVPLYEAKMVTYFDHRWGYYPDGTDDDTRALPRPSEAEKKDPAYDIGPRFWVDASDVAARLHEKGWRKQWLLGHRGLTNNTNERTFITSLVPRRGAGNSFTGPKDIDVSRPFGSAGPYPTEIKITSRSSPCTFSMFLTKTSSDRPSRKKSLRISSWRRATSSTSVSMSDCAFEKATTPRDRSGRVRACSATARATASASILFVPGRPVPRDRLVYTPGTR